MDPIAATNAKARADHNIELLKAVVSSGESVLKTLLLINGGAAVAVLAFLGNVVTKELPKGVTLSVPNVASGLVRFAVAVAIIGAGALFRFLSIWYSRTRYTQAELVFAALAVLSGFAAVFEFVCGCLWVAGAIR